MFIILKLRLLNDRIDRVKVSFEDSLDASTRYYIIVSPDFVRERENHKLDVVERVSLILLLLLLSTIVKHFAPCLVRMYTRFINCFSDYAIYYSLSVI